MQKEFISTHFNNRNILILIDHLFITFYFDYSTNQDEFYDFYKEDWHGWMKPHMQSKSWFTQEMADFITANIQPC